MADSGVKRPRKRKTKLTQAEAISQALAAKHDLTMLEGAFEQYADGLFQQWMLTEPHELEKREQIHASFRAVGGARAELIRIINGGQIAEHEAAMAERLKSN